MYAVNLNDSQRCPYAALRELIRQAINEGADRFTDFQEDEQLTLRLQKNPPCVRIDDYSAIPDA